MAGGSRLTPDAISSEGGFGGTARMLLIAEGSLPHAANPTHCRAWSFQKRIESTYWALVVPTRNDESNERAG